ncbi:hypothetical protein RYX56_04825 [Alkalihalophilus lindianensis]|uniref:Uncharacterized protein n=1 Tax=Alkalihalophilus lindianensis TaxID=1630542 RepID=A0ABU3X8D3_9BACI|nr:hypothetical protein [Alkalihalophilus lindianensis]MDV2683699.1 hypothetical protein [Alkalihalophilus lindianensis]
MFKGLVIFSMCLLFLLYSFFPIDLLELILSILAAIILLFVINQVKLPQKMISLILLLSGISIYVLMNVHITDALQGLLRNLPLLSLLLLVPLLAIPMKVSGYLESTYHYLSKWQNDSNKAFMGLTSLLSLLAPVLNMGSVRLVHEVARDVQFPTKLLGKSYFIGFSTAMLWSPYFASVALVLVSVNVRVTDYILVGLGYGVIQLGLGMLLFRFAKVEDEGVRIKAIPNATINESLHRLNIVKLISMIVGMIVSLLVLESFTTLSMLVLVSLISLIIPILWWIGSQQKSRMKDSFQEYLLSISSKSQNEIVLFLSAGFFGSAISYTSVARIIETTMGWASSVSLLFFIGLVVVIVSMFAMAGVHQIIIVPLLAMYAGTDVTGITPVALAVIFLMAWALSSILSPLNAINMLVSSLLGRSGFTTGMKWNGVYLFLLFVVGVMMAYSIQLLN